MTVAIPRVVLAQTKPTPVKAVAADATLPTTRVSAGAASTAVPTVPVVAAGDTIPAAAPVTKAKVGSSSNTKTKVHLAAASIPTADDVLNSKAITLTDRARADVKAGLVDPRLLGTLVFMSKKFPIEVSTLRTGHSRYVSGTSRESNHYFGRGADISKVDGSPVTRSNQAALALANYLLTLPGDVRPTELGSPWTGDGSGADVEVFSDEGHDNHLHIGFDA